MISGRIGSELAVMAVFCVLMIFLFPAMQGPYSVVNGPVTALPDRYRAGRIELRRKLPSFVACSPVLDVTSTGRIPVD